MVLRLPRTLAPWYSAQISTDGRCEGKVIILHHLEMLYAEALTVAKTPGVQRAAEQYGLLSRLVDCVTFDVTRNPLRRGNIFDAIITDPPCELVILRRKDHLA